MGTRWIADNTVICREVHGTRSEQHNSVNGSPSFSVRLEIPTAQLKLALSKLLGKPEDWPHDTVFTNVKAVSAQIVVNPGQYTTDADGQLLYPANATLVDMTYMPRHGVYITEIYSGQPVYWDDTLEPRLESIPADHTALMWGTEDPSTIPPSNDRLPLHSDNAPSKYEPGEQLTHLIEGWYIDTSIATNLIGTCNYDAYTSIPLKNRVFAAGTLLLRNVVITYATSYNSYKLTGPASGKLTATLKCVYEYRKLGWQRFYRIDTMGNKDGYYHIRYNTDPFSLYKPFPLEIHNMLRIVIP